MGAQEPRGAVGRARPVSVVFSNVWCREYRCAMLLWYSSYHKASAPHCTRYTVPSVRTRRPAPVYRRTLPYSLIKQYGANTCTVATLLRYTTVPVRWRITYWLLCAHWGTRAAPNHSSYYAGTQRGTHCSYCGLCGKRSSCGHGAPHQERTHTAGAHKEPPPPWRRPPPART